MKKFIRLIKRSPAIAPEAFQLKLLGQDNEPLIATPGLVRYVQNHPLLGGYRRGDLVCDGIEEFWFEDAVAMETVRNIAFQDPTFIDQASTQILAVDVHLLKDGEVPEAIKSFELVKRRGDLELKAFREYWRSRHGPLACGIAFSRYEQNHRSDEGYASDSSIYDGAAVTWFRSTDEMRATVDTEIYRETRKDEANFLDGPLPVVLARERLRLQIQ